MKKLPSSFERLIGAKTNLKNAVDYKGYKWLVGEVSRNSEYPVNLEDLLFYYPLVVKSLNLKDEIIAVSLPAETYFEDKISGGEIITNISLNIYEETKKSVLVLPQGAIASYYIFNKGFLEPDTTLVIDGGFNTVNIVIVNREGEIQYSKTYYNEFGIRDLIENYFKPELKRKYPETTSNLMRLKEIFLNETIDAGLKVINISGEKNIALQTFIERLFNRILKDIERAGLSFKQFTIIGGLSYYVPEIDTNKPYYIPEKNGEFYTVLGMNLYTGKPSIDFGFGDIKIV